jgi:hypothetical protein
MTMEAMGAEADRKNGRKLSNSRAWRMLRTDAMKAQSAPLAKAQKQKQPGTVEGSAVFV